jgi:hypothetical protein
MTIDHFFAGVAIAIAYGIAAYLFYLGIKK